MILDACTKSMLTDACFHFGRESSYGLTDSDSIMLFSSYIGCNLNKALRIHGDKVKGGVYCDSTGSLNMRTWHQSF